MDCEFLDEIRERSSLEKDDPQGDIPVMEVKETTWLLTGECRSHKRTKS